MAFDPAAYQQMVQSNLRQMLAARGIDPDAPLSSAANQAGQSVGGLAQTAQQGLGTLGKIATIKALSGGASAAAPATAANAVQAARAVTTPALASEPLLGVGVGPLAAIAGATYLGGKSAYDMIRGKEDKSIPGYVGRGTLAIATGGLSELARGLFGGKSKEAIQRESYRDTLKNLGIADSNYKIGNFNTADGSRKEFNVDFSDSSAGQRVGLTNALGRLLAGSGKNPEQMVGYLANSLSGSKDVYSDARNLYQKAGYTKEKALADFEALKNQGKVKADEYAAMRAGIDQVFSGGKNAKKK